MQQIKRTPLVNQVVEKLIEFIQSDAVDVGQKMPSETALCKQMNVSRSTVREALRILQVMGHIDIRPGSGAFLHSKHPNDQLAVDWFAKHSYELLDSLEVRASIEPVIARLAATRATENELYALIGVQTLFKQAVAEKDSAQMALYDEQFHTRLAKASHNPLLVNITGVIAKALLSFRSKTFVLNDGSDAQKAHERILEAIRSRDGAAAERFMADHLKENIEMAHDYVRTE